ncbi:MAG: aspartate/glutamate racemase family protein [Candidatus Thorarchaeota archaeon]
MAKRIGILGGISHTSTVKYYELLLQKYHQRKQDYYFPEIVIYSLNLQKFTDYEDRGEREGYIAYIMQGIRALEHAGADFIVIAANSAHAVFQDVEKAANVPLVSIVEVTAKHARDAGMKKLLLLGIKFTMQAAFYRDICENYGMTIIIPSEEEQDEINRIIFEELVLGSFKEESRSYLLRIIASSDADGVILGCTELPLLLRQEDVNIRLFDTLELHVKAALDYSQNNRQEAPPL